MSSTFTFPRKLNTEDTVPNLERALEAMAEDFPPWEAIRKFRILETDFTLESGELTPTLKVKRRVIEERYRSILDGFYGGEGFE